LQHVEGLTAAALANDDAVWAHAERVAHEVADRVLAATLEVRWTRLERDDVRLPEAHPVALFTALHALEPLAVGTTRLERRGGRTRARAVVHDLGAEPTTRPDWSEAAFADGLTRLEAAGVARAVTPGLGTAHAPIARTVALAAMVRGALRVPARATRMVAVVVDAAVDRLALEDVLFARGAPP
jgi:hypothetical protein